MSPRTLERLFRTHSLSSDTLHSLLIPANHESQLQPSYGTPQPNTSRPTTETAFGLLLRLRAPDPELIHIHRTVDLNERPLLISISLLENASPLFATELRYHDTLRLETDGMVYATSSTGYWLYDDCVPGPGDFNGDWSEPLTDREIGEYEELSVQSWGFAEKWSMPRLQNTIMDALFGTLVSRNMISPKVMKVCLEISRKQGAMRFALIWYMLWSDDIEQEHHPEVFDEDSRLSIDTVDFREVDGFDDDLCSAMDVLVRKGRKACALGELTDCAKPKAKRFYVPEE